MKSAPSLFITAAALLASAHAHAASTLRQDLTAYPNDRGTCQETAALVGQEAQQATGLTVLRAACAADNNRTYDLVIYYQIDGAQEVVTTAHEYEPDYIPGNYASREDCAAALGDERALFTQATGLPVAVSYCYYSDVSGDMAWEARVDGVGVPAMRPYVSGAIFFTAPYDTRGADIEATLKTALANHGVTPRSVHVRFTSGFYLASVSAYATERFQLRADEVAYSETRQQCEAQAASFTAVLSSTDGLSAPLATYCGDRFSINGAQLMSFYFNSPAFVLKAAEGIYADNAACEADRVDVVNFHRDQLGETVYGGLCSLGDDPLDPRTSNGWHVALMEPVPTQRR